MGRAMSNRIQSILVVSDDAALCAAARREFEASATGLRVASVTSIAAARRILEEDAPAVILLEEAAIALEADEARGIVPRLAAAVSSLAAYAAVGGIGGAARGTVLSPVVDSGAADYGRADGGCLPLELRPSCRQLA